MVSFLLRASMPRFFPRLPAGARVHVMRHGAGLAGARREARARGLWRSGEVDAITYECMHPALDFLASMRRRARSLAQPTSMASTLAAAGVAHVIASAMVEFGRLIWRRSKHRSCVRLCYTIYAFHGNICDLLMCHLV